MKIIPLALVVMVSASLACNQPAGSESPGSSWLRFIENTGTYSSARLVDLNRDNVPDIVIGAGGREEVSSDTAVLALDGKTGNILWAIGGDNQYVGSAIFRDINGDSIPDVFIGGRWAQFSAINGANGKLIWQFYPERKTKDGGDGGWYNFTTPQFVPDQDGDMVPDMLVANGGDARAAAGDTARPAGKLLVISSVSGRLLADVDMPDGKETYMSVLCYDTEGKDCKVVFGSGGETIGGHLYRTSLADIMRKDISRAKVLAVSENKGFIASPALVDLNNDGTRDLVANAVEGRMIAINGVTDAILWQKNFPGTEAYTVPAVGMFGPTGATGVFANFAIGTFPRLTKSLRFMVDGFTGKIGFQDTIPSFQYASAIAADVNGDRIDEIIVNRSALKRQQFGNSYSSYLEAIDFKNNTIFSIGEPVPATNLASTPWIGDMDKDGKFDFVYTAVKYEDAKFDLQQPLGLYVARFRSDIAIVTAPRWSAFMGANYTGIY